MKISVIVPTYRRPQALLRCLQGIAKQNRPADEIIVVVREEDADTRRTVEKFVDQTESQGLLAALRVIPVSRPGVVAAQNAAVAFATGEILAFTDDDAVPRPDWLERLEQYFANDPTVGAVGGRDWIHQQGSLADIESSVVGKVQWFGRVLGNHHLGVGAPRAVDVLKGVNWALRRQAAQGMDFDERLRGSGAQVHWELSFCLQLKKRGWKLVYDPAVSLDHYPAPRFDLDQRGVFHPDATVDAVHNETVALLDYLPWWRRVVFWIWAMAVGTVSAPGFVQWVRLSVRGDSHATTKLLATVRGRIMGRRTWMRSRGPKAEVADHTAKERFLARRPTLAIVAHNVNRRGGMERHLAEMIERAKGDYEVTVIASELDDIDRAGLHFVRIPVPNSPFLLKSMLFAVQASIHLLFRRYDLVHTTGAIVFNRVNLATVHFCHVGYMTQTKNARMNQAATILRRLNAWLNAVLAVRMERFCYKPQRISRLVAVSEQVRRELLAHFPYPEKMVSAIPNGVDSQWFRQPACEERTALRRQFGIPENAFIVLFVGGDWNRKGLSVLAEAVVEVVERGARDTLVLVVGKGDPGSVLRHISETCHEHIRFMGFQPNTLPFYQLADIFAFPSEYEACSLVLLEAAASGLPAVATPVGGADYTVIPHLTGILAGRDPAAFAEALWWLYTHPQERQQMSREARKRAECLTWDATYAGFKKVYTQLLSTKGRGHPVTS